MGDWRLPTLHFQVTEEYNPFLYKEFSNKINLWRLKDDLEDKEEKLHRMYERPLSASASMLNSGGKRKSKKTTLDRVNKMRLKQKRKAEKMKRRRDSMRERYP